MKFNIQPVTGDASFRTFYRFKEKKSSKIIIVSNKDKYKNLIAYCAINNFLRKNKILAPKLYNYNIAKGIILIEDFGNLSFYNILIKKKNKFFLYKKLVDLLLQIQKIKPKTKIRNINNQFHKVEKYNNQYLLKESNLFFDWYLTLFLSRKKAIYIKS